jgi:hypothetical protein
VTGRPPQDWDDDAVGSVDEAKNRRWRRSWHHYAAYLLGAVGFAMLIGALGARAGAGTMAAACVLAASAAVVRADGPRPTERRPRPRVPSRREELGWYAAAAALVVLGVVLTTV